MDKSLGYLFIVKFVCFKDRFVRGSLLFIVCLEGEVELGWIYFIILRGFSFIEVL